LAICNFQFAIFGETKKALTTEGTEVHREKKKINFYLLRGDFRRLPSTWVENRKSKIV